jgi:hypothetical protein
MEDGFGVEVGTIGSEGMGAHRSWFRAVDRQGATPRGSEGVERVLDRRERIAKARAVGVIGRVVFKKRWWPGQHRSEPAGRHGRAETSGPEAEDRGPKNRGSNRSVEQAWLGAHPQLVWYWRGVTPLGFNLLPLTEPPAGLATFLPQKGRAALSKAIHEKNLGL